VGVVRLSGGEEVDELVMAVREVRSDSVSRGEVKTSEILSGASGISVGVVGFDAEGGRG